MSKMQKPSPDADPKGSNAEAALVEGVKADPGETEVSRPELEVTPSEFEAEGLLTKDGGAEEAEEAEDGGKEPEGGKEAESLPDGADKTPPPPPGPESDITESEIDASIEKAMADYEKERPKEADFYGGDPEMLDESEKRLARMEFNQAIRDFEAAKKEAGGYIRATFADAQVAAKEHGLKAKDVIAAMQKNKIFNARIAARNLHFDQAVKDAFEKGRKEGEDAAANKLKRPENPARTLPKGGRPPVQEQRHKTPEEALDAGVRVLRGMRQER